MNSNKKNRKIHQTMALLALVLALLICVAVVVFTLPRSSGAVQTAGGYGLCITEIMGSNGAYPDPDGRCCDWLEICNATDSDLDLGGYRLSDNKNSVKYTIPEGTVLAAGDYLVVWCDAAGDGGRAPFAISREGGETIYLMNSRNVTVDTVFTLPMSKNAPMVRDAAGNWSIGAYGTPGFENSSAGYDAYLASRSAASFPVHLSEIMASNTLYPGAGGGLSDWVELYNSTHEDVDISGCGLSDTPEEVKYTFPAGTVVPAGGYLVVGCGIENGVDFRIARGGGEILCLQSPSGDIIDRVSLPALEQNEAYALDADGSWQKTYLASPGYENSEAGHAAFYGAATVTACPVIVSELMAENRSCMTDADGDFSDWAELYNPGGETVDLAGFWLSDDAQQPLKWYIRSLSLAPGERKVIFCSGKNRVENGEYHTDFSLSQYNEGLYLVSPEGAVCAGLSYEKMLPDMALISDNGTDRLETYQPTPGYENSGSGHLRFLEGQSREELVISEVMSANNAVLRQDDGEYYDWVELENRSGTALNLADYRLSEDADDRNAWVLPDVTLEPGARCVILLAGPEGAEGDIPWADFSLNGEEDWLYLFDSRGRALDYVRISGLPYQGSMGRMSGQAGFFYFAVPTPGEENLDGRRSLSAMPVSSAAPGVYDNVDSLRVELSGSGTIYYTTDGSLPTADSAVYSGPFEFRETTVLRAMCLQEGCLPSEVLTLSFIINENHTLPVASLVANPDDIFGYDGIYVDYFSGEEIYGNISYFEPDGSFSADCGVALYGSLSRQTNNKKSFKLSFRPVYGPSEVEYGIFDDGGVDYYSSLVLRSGQDYPLAVIREELMTSLANDASDSLQTQRFQYCVLYVNGEYFGIYSLKEAFSEDYYANAHNVSADSVTLLRVIDVAGADANLYPLMVWAANCDISDPENYQKLTDNFDMESLADWIIFQAYCGNSDILNNVRYMMSTEEDSRWRWGFYDLDWSFNTHSNITDNSVLVYGQQYSILPRVALRNENFQDFFLKRLAHHLQNTLATENVLARIDELCAEIRPEMARERERWDGNVESWEQDVQDIKDFITQPGRDVELIDAFCLYLGLTEAEKASYFGGMY